MSELTLAKALDWDDPQSSKSASQLDSRKDKLLAKFEVPWVALRQTLLQRLAEQLDIPCSGLFLAAWKKHDEIREFADPAKHPPGEDNEVNLIDHEIEYTYSPTLEVSFGLQRVASAQLDLNFKFTLEGVILRIRDAKIVAVTPGSGKATAELKLANATLVTAESKKLDLGTAHTLAEPISI